MKPTVRSSSDEISDASVFLKKQRPKRLPARSDLASRARKASEGRGITYTLRRRTAPS